MEPVFLDLHIHTSENPDQLDAAYDVATLHEGTQLGLPSRAGGPIPFQQVDSTGNLDLWIMNADGTGPRVFLHTSAQEMDLGIVASR